MRGKPRSSTRRSPTPRIIPAHAGQTSDYFSSEIISSDHPRACGANLIVFGVVHTHLGSSPRMRGKPHCFRCRPYSPRIIPAHAGQTRQTLHIECGLEDHPRACGANVDLGYDGGASVGSSPRMRGKPLRFLVFDPCGRIIPAHAGQTVCGACSTSVATDHPRACGANPP